MSIGLFYQNDVPFKSDVALWQNNMSLNMTEYLGH